MVEPMAVLEAETVVAMAAPVVGRGHSGWLDYRMQYLARGPPSVSHSRCNRGPDHKR